MIRPIKGKLGIVFLVLAFLPLFVIRLVVYPIIHNTMQDELMKNLGGIGDRQKNLLTVWLKDREKDAMVFANSPDVIKCMELMKDDEEFEKTLEHLRFVKKQYGYNGISVIDKTGRVRLTTELEMEGKDVSKFDYFKDAIQGNTFVTRIRPSEIPIENEVGQMELGMPTMFVFTPIKDRTGENIGVVVLRINVVEITKIMQSIKLGETGETYLINEEGLMVSESKFLESLKEKGLAQKRTALELKLIDPQTGELTVAARECLKKKSGYNSFGYTDYRGVRVIGYWHWIPEYNLGLIAEIDVEEGFGVLYKLRNSIVTVFALLAMAVVIISFALGKKISTPITQLAEAADRMVKGDLDQKIEINTKDELSELANSLNQMAELLKKKTDNGLTEDRQQTNRGQTTDKTD